MQPIKNRESLLPSTVYHPLSNLMTAPAASSATLLSIVSCNANTEIGRRWNFAAIQSVDDFRTNVPLTDYEVYRPYIQRMMENGEKDLIASGEVLYYAPTSGTTSKSKFIPKYTHFKENELKLAAPLGRTLVFANMFATMWTPLGVPVTPGSAKHLQALLSAEPYDYPAPPEAYYIADLTDALYVQIVFTLKRTTLTNWTNSTTIMSFFISTLLTALNILASEWKQMVKDIQQGRLKHSLKLTLEERESLQEAMGGPDPARANELKSIFNSASVTNFRNIIPQLWPSVDLVSVLCGGEFSHYIPRLQYFLGESISLFSFFYVSSEGLLGVNKWPYKRTSAYALLPESKFYEFIPLDQTESPDPEVLLTDEIEVNKDYEIVITTGEGLYRYRLGDIIKVVEKSHEGPVIDVVGRKKMAINLNGCKLYAFQVNDAIGALISHFKDQSMDTDYLISADTSVIPPRYIVWLECEGSDVTATEASAIIDGHLRSVNLEYAGSVEDGIIGQLAIKMLKPEAIADVKRILKPQSAVGETQMKLPRVVWDAELLDFLASRTINDN